MCNEISVADKFFNFASAPSFISKNQNKKIITNQWKWNILRKSEIFAIFFIHHRFDWIGYHDYEIGEKIEDQTAAIFFSVKLERHFEDMTNMYDSQLSNILMF